eukprot:scaffold301_cov243-Pinguiococcus_pyrenoidosus.AAC.118
MTHASANMHYDASEAPRARFDYRINPIGVTVRKGGRKWYEFFTSLTALLGGTVTLFGLANMAFGALFKGGLRVGSDLRPRLPFRSPCRPFRSPCPHVDLLQRYLKHLQSDASHCGKKSRRGMLSAPLGGVGGKCDDTQRRNIRNIQKMPGLPGQVAPVALWRRCLVRGALLPHNQVPDVEALIVASGEAKERVRAAGVDHGALERRCAPGSKSSRPNGHDFHRPFLRLLAVQEHL